MLLLHKANSQSDIGFVLTEPGFALWLAQASNSLQMARWHQCIVLTIGLL